MNVIVIVVDTLRYDHIGAHGNDWIQTPNLDRLASESWVFDRAFSASYPTIPHRTDAMTGAYGAPFHRWLPLRHDRPTLPETFGEAGWATQLIHDTPHLVNGGHNFDWPFNAWTQIRGAEVDRPWIDDSREFPDNWTRDPLWDFVDGEPESLGLIPTYVRANRNRDRDEDWNCARLFLTAGECLRANASRENLFLWVDCFDPHEPWDVPPEFARMYDDDPDWDGRIDPRSFMIREGPDIPVKAARRIAAQFAGKCSWVDRWLGVLLETLDDTGMADNTLVLLTADHGTNVGERGRFGKYHPVMEQEAHVPFIVRPPGGESGRSDVIVQPQDIFATIAGQCGVPLPEGIESFDVLAAARNGETGERPVALSGRNAEMGWSKPGAWLFTVMDGEWYLELSVRLEDCRLVRAGEIEDVAADNPDVVRRLYAAGIEDIARRGIDPKLMAWLRSGGEADFPEDACFYDGHPGPAGYKAYFSRTWKDW
jgi:arylsulfatase A-like enzyme